MQLPPGSWFAPPGRWDEKVRSLITDGAKLPVINACYGAITVDKEIDLEEVLSLVNHPHSTTAEFIDDTIVRDGLPNHWAEMLGVAYGEVNVRCVAKTTNSGPID